MSDSTDLKKDDTSTTTTSAFLTELVTVTEQYMDETLMDDGAVVGCSDNEFDENTSSFRILPAAERIRCRKRNRNGIWNYFALAEKENASKEDCRILCLQCYDHGDVQVYKRSTSSSNLWKHLSKKHDIKPSKERLVAMTGGREDVMGFVTTTSSAEDNSKQADGKMHKIEPFVQLIKLAIDDPIDVKKQITKDLGLFLIKEVAKRPLLYKYHKQNQIATKPKRNELWREIYNESGCLMTIDRLKKVWKNIRDRYTKIKNLEKQGFQSYQRYKYYDHLRFLDGDDGGTIDYLSHSDDDLEPAVKKERSDIQEPQSKECETYEFVTEKCDTYEEISHNGSNTMYAVCSKSNSPVHDDMEHTDNVIPDEIQIDHVEEHVNDVDEDFSSGFNECSIEPPARVSVNKTNTNQCHCGQQVHSSSGMHDEFDLFGRFIAEKLRNTPRNCVNEIELEIMGILVKKRK